MRPRTIGILLAAAVAACGDATGPAPKLHVVSGTPSLQAAVSPTASLEVTLDDPADVTTLADAFLVTGRYGRIEGTLTPSETGRAFTFTPAAPMKRGDHVTATLTAPARGKDGRPLDHPYTFEFRVATNPASAAPSLVDSLRMAPAGEPTAPTDIFGGDFDGDGLIDILISNSLSRDVRLYLNDGAGGYLQPGALAIDGGRPSDVEGMDVDGDGAMDALVAAAGSLVLLHGRGAAGLADDATAFGADASRICRVIPGVEVITYGRSQVWTIPVTDHALGAPSMRSIAGIKSACAAVDVDRDGVLDLLIGDETANTVTLYLGRGGHAYTESTATPTVDPPSALAAGDFNGDGFADYAVFSSTGRSMFVFLNDGSAPVHFSPAGRIDVASTVGAAAVDVGDIDGDGHLDMVVASGANEISVLTNEQGRGLFSSTSSYLVGDGARGVLLEDLDGDGDLDIAAIGALEGWIYFFRNGS